MDYGCWTRVLTPFSLLSPYSLISWEARQDPHKALRDLGLKAAQAPPWSWFLLLSPSFSFFLLWKYTPDWTSRVVRKLYNAERSQALHDGTHLLFQHLESWGRWVKASTGPAWTRVPSAKPFRSTQRAKSYLKKKINMMTVVPTLRKLEQDGHQF